MNASNPFFNQPGFPSGGGIGERFRQFFTSKTILSRLILVNLAVFLFVQLINLFLWLFQVNSPYLPLSIPGFWLSVPAEISQLLIKPWTVISYMFLHEGFLHLFFNMIMLYFGGLIFREYLSPGKLLYTYLIGGISGAVFYILAFNIFPAFHEVLPVSQAQGASASVLAVLIAIAAYVPDYTVHLLLIGRLKLKHLALIFILIDLVSIQGGNAGGHIAHLGGAFWGFIYGWLLRSQKIDMYALRWWKGYSFNNFNKKKSRQTHSRPVNDEAYNAQKAERQERIDQILEKISRSGYSSLTKQEKELLFKASNKV